MSRNLITSRLLFNIHRFSLLLQESIVLVHMLLVRLSVPEDRIVQGTRSGAFLWVVFASMIKQLLLSGKIRPTIFKKNHFEAGWPIWPFCGQVPKTWHLLKLFGHKIFRLATWPLFGYFSKVRKLCLYYVYFFAFSQKNSKNFWLHTFS